MIEIRIVLNFDFVKVSKKNKVRAKKTPQMSSQCISNLESSIFMETEQNKLKPVDVSSSFIKYSDFMGKKTKYPQYLVVVEAVFSPPIEVVTASMVLLLNISNCFGHIYNPNAKNSKNLTTSLYFTLL